MKRIINFLTVCFVVTLFASCEKDNITNSYIEENPERMDAIAKDLKKALASSPKGWVMMVKTTLNQDVYTPIVLQFDTITNKVKVTTVYGNTAESDSYFRIANGIGSPQLIFTTGSIMSSLYRVGVQASDITDHIYNVVSVSSDTVAIRGYRSGRVYTPEGGVIYKMFKRPDSWTWADGHHYMDFSSADFNQNVLTVPSTVTLQYVNTPNRNRTFNSGFSAVPATSINTLRNGFAFQISRNIGTGGFQPTNYVYFRFPYVAANGVTTNYDASPVVANNSLSFLPQPAGGATSVANMNFFNTTFGFHYLTCKSVTRSGNNVKMEFEAYDQKGNVIVRAFYDNLL